MVRLLGAQLRYWAPNLAADLRGGTSRPTDDMCNSIKLVPHVVWPLNSRLGESAPAFYCAAGAAASITSCSSVLDIEDVRRVVCHSLGCCDAERTRQCQSPATAWPSPPYNVTAAVRGVTRCLV